MIVDPPEGMRKVTEWAKQQACWSRVARLELDWPKTLELDLVSAHERRDAKGTAVRDQRMLNGIQAQRIGGRNWTRPLGELKAWGLSSKLQSPTDMGILDIAGSMPSRVPSEKQSLRAIEILRRFREEGCPLGADIA